MGHLYIPGVPEEPEAEAAPNRRFKFLISVSEIHEGDTPEEQPGEELLVQFGGEVMAATFTEATTPLSQELSKEWNRILDMAHVVDAP